MSKLTLSDLIHGDTYCIIEHDECHCHGIGGKKGHHHTRLAVVHGFSGAITPLFHILSTDKTEKVQRSRIIKHYSKGEYHAMQG